MTIQTEVPLKTEFRIPPATLPGYACLTVADLDRQLTFYQEVIGLKAQRREGATADLGVGGQPLLRLVESPHARRYRGTTGLYHFAILLPNKRELARAVRRLFELQYRNYPTDHIMTKTTYLDDPEGNNIELYADSPEDGLMEITNGSFQSRRADGSLSDGREALDVAALFKELAPDDHWDVPMPPDTRIGHFHLYVASLDETLHFYHDVLGFDDMGVSHSFRMGMVSAGRYHHHIGFNTWVGEGAPPAPAGALGMRYFTFRLPDQSGLEQVVEHVRQAGLQLEQNEAGLAISDPSKNLIVLTAPPQE